MTKAIKHFCILAALTIMTAALAACGGTKTFGITYADVPLDYGETTLTVQAQWKDVAAEYLTETIDVVVKDDVSVGEIVNMYDIVDTMSCAHTLINIRHGNLFYFSEHVGGHHGGAGAHRRGHESQSAPRARRDKGRLRSVPCRFAGQTERGHGHT